MKINLNDGWLMSKSTGGTVYNCNVPCSVYKTLIDEKAIPDPYYRENEYISTQICDDDYTFEKHFYLTDSQLEKRNPADCHEVGGDTRDKIFLQFDGIDTLAEVSLNGIFLFDSDNMHRIWEFDVTRIVKSGENVLTVKIKSPNKYIEQEDKKRHLWGVDSTMTGYTHLRKAHCMFGWDWGPKLPDMGIWRDVTLNFFSGGRIRDIYYSQVHENGKVTLKCRGSIDIWGELTPRLTVISPDGEIFTHDFSQRTAEITIKNPRLWWVNGFGGQPLYKCTVELIDKSGQVVDSNTQRIGLRTLTISQDKDEWGEEFCFINNGVKIFAMGGNYIPEDQIVTRCTKEKNVRLLEDCKKANFNFIRVWGGGYYPDNYFYDWCDENGFIVWQDFMFACSAYLLTDRFKSTVEKEVRDNIIRLRNHPSLGLWCGNNEIESAWEYWGLPEDEEAKSDYLTLFEGIIPSLLRKYDPDGNTFYWPSSPSSGGGFKDSSSNHAGDMHYWDVWHNFKPIEDFRKYHYRFCSEYGFEALPDIKTCRAFADESKGDFDLCSNVMDAHQKCTQGNEKVMYYLAQMVNYPYSFRRLIYCSQLVQADCIRSDVEHMRRARGRCMGSAYWQINDSNPVISWSSIDFFGRWKGLHYTARKFYAPVLISCDDSDPSKPVLNVSNESPDKVSGKVICRLRDNTGAVTDSFSTDCEIPAVSAKNVLEINLSDRIDFSSRFDKRSKYLEYSLVVDGETVSRGTTLFVRPKFFEFLPAEVAYTANDKGDTFEISFTAHSFAKSVCVSLKDYDCVFSDNWFDIHGSGDCVKITLDKKYVPNLTAEELTKQIVAENY
jgi:beta-mannosidase